MKRSVLLFFIAIVTLLIGVLIFQTIIYTTVKRGSRAATILSVKERKEYANTLLAKGLTKEATRAFEDLLQEKDIKKTEMAQIAYRLGSLYMELFEYENALASFYRAEQLNPNASFRSEMNQKIVEALENCGMSSQAQYEMQARTSLKPSRKKEGVPVARIGDETITKAEINREIDQLPAWMKKEYEDEAKRYQFMREYVGREVLYRKAKRLGLDQKKEVRERLELVKKELAIERLLEREVAQKVKISDEDIRLYYNAHKDKYKEPESLNISYVKFDDATKKDEMIAALQEGKVEKKDVSVRKDDVYLPGIGEAKDTVATLFTKNKGTQTDALKIKDSFYIFSIDDKKEERQKSFYEVKQQIEYEMTLEKQKKLTQKLMEKTLEEQEVEFFYVPKQKREDASGEKTTEALVSEANEPNSGEETNEG